MAATERLSPKEVRERRLLPYEVKERWGFPRDAQRAELPVHVQWEFDAAQAAYAESQAAGTAREDYPQLYRVSPSADLVSIDGLTVHEYQL
jgi:hypothetical protein